MQGGVLVFYFSASGILTLGWNKRDTRSPAHSSVCVLCSLCTKRYAAVSVLLHKFAEALWLQRRLMYRPGYTQPNEKRLLDKERQGEDSSIVVVMGPPAQNTRATRVSSLLCAFYASSIISMKLRPTLHHLSLPCTTISVIQIDSYPSFTTGSMGSTAVESHIVKKKSVSRGSSSGCSVNRHISTSTLKYRYEILVYGPLAPQSRRSLCTPTALLCTPTP